MTTIWQKYILYPPRCCRNPNDNSYQMVSTMHQAPCKQLTFVIFCCYLVPTAILQVGYYYYLPLANKKTDISKSEQGPCLPAPGWITSSQQCLAHGRHSMYICLLYEWRMSGWATSCTTPIHTVLCLWPVWMSPSWATSCTTLGSLCTWQARNDDQG